VKHADFHIGKEFYTGSGRWRCTDVGTRVIVAISQEPREVVRQSRDAKGVVTMETYVSNDPCDLIGPPYKIAEYVFDEYDLGGCWLERFEP
jgi:hypothetical protein